MFAQLQAADPVHLRDFLIILVVLIGTTTNIITMMRGRDVQKREVSMAADFATRDQVKEVQHAADSAVRTALEDINELRDSLTRIHERIDALERDVGATPDRVIAQLNNSFTLFSKQK